MSKPNKAGGAAIAGWLLTLAGGVALATLAYGVLQSDYRRRRLFALLEGSSNVHGIGLESWLILAMPIVLMAVGIGLIATARPPRGVS